MKRPSLQRLTAVLVLAGIICSIASFIAPTHRLNARIFGQTGGRADEPPRIKPVLRTIIIDPGHGGFDPGTHGLFSKEKDLALAISLKLGKAIQEQFPDMKIVFTRTTDIMPGNMPTKNAGLHYRAEVANKSHGDLFICIHGNSDGHAAGRYQARRVIGHKYVGKGKHRRKRPIYEYYWVTNTRVGTGSYIWKADRNVFKGKAIAEREGGDSEDGGDNAGDSARQGGEELGDSATEAFDMSAPEARVKAQLYEKKFFANSALFATLVEDEFVKAGRHSDGVMQRDEGIQVLQATGMPSVLIETGFLTNKEEEEYLNSEDGQNEIVRNIVDALKRYKDALESTHLYGNGASDSSGTGGGGTRRNSLHLSR
jgi:N-acetylmuramoyl-L-alanine amidase